MFNIGCFLIVCLSRLLFRHFVCLSLVGVVGGGGYKLLKAILKIIFVIIFVRLTMELSK